MTKRKRVVAYLTPENEHNFSAHIKRSGMAESALVNYALAEFYNNLHNERVSNLKSVNELLEENNG